MWSFLCPSLISLPLSVHHYWTLPRFLLSFLLFLIVFPRRFPLFVFLSFLPLLCLISRFFSFFRFLSPSLFFFYFPPSNNPPICLSCLPSELLFLVLFRSLFRSFPSSFLPYSLIRLLFFYLALFLPSILHIGVCILPHPPSQKSQPLTTLQPPVVYLRLSHDVSEGQAAF